MSKIIKNIDDISSSNFYDIEIDSFWNIGKQKELKTHRIHSYPAKFPAFISEKALEYVAKKGYYPRILADIFCGCGTVAIEAKRKNIDFWGCDINPVATMITKAKSNYYNIKRISKYLDLILNKFQNTEYISSPYNEAQERLKYWYFEEQYNDLFKLKQALEEIIPVNSPYRAFFYCAFSNILKSTSGWLTKSIKPQLDPNKIPANVITAFSNQCENMIRAYEDIETKTTSKTKIITGSFLNKKIKFPDVDMIITSPPYVTSYEYADLHQLSSLWLGYTNDYRKLRTGSIGSLYHNYKFDIKKNNLNKTGQNVVSNLYVKDKNKARSVAKYFEDMKTVIMNCGTMIKSNGFILLVMGDTEYKGVHIENARHIVELLYLNGFENIEITKRKVSGKILTPYRDSLGRFTTNSESRKVYSEEFIILGKKI